MADPAPATVGVDHVGLSVRNLESTRRFFAAASGGMSSVSGLTIPPSSSPTAANHHLVAVESPGKRRSRLTGAPMSGCITSRWPWPIAQAGCAARTPSRAGRTSSWNFAPALSGKDRNPFHGAGTKRRSA